MGLVDAFFQRRVQTVVGNKSTLNVQKTDLHVFRFRSFPERLPWMRKHFVTSACFSVLELSQTIAMILTSACLSVLELSRPIVWMWKHFGVFDFRNGLCDHNGIT